MIFSCISILQSEVRLQGSTGAPLFVAATPDLLAWGLAIGDPVGREEVYVQLERNNALVTLFFTPENENPRQLLDHMTRCANAATRYMAFDPTWSAWEKRTRLVEHRPLPTVSPVPESTSKKEKTSSSFVWPLLLGPVPSAQQEHKPNAATSTDGTECFCFVYVSVRLYLKSLLRSCAV
jgi:hypothetical protein